jgi:hypothetical protein
LHLPHFLPLNLGVSGPSRFAARAYLSGQAARPSIIIRIGKELGAVPSSSPSAPRRPSGRLRDCLISLAGTPDDDSAIDSDLVAIAQLADDRLSAVSYASVTSRFQNGWATVAATSELAAAVDQAQYTDDAGPCLDALVSGRPTAVPEIAATMVWPHFREIAAELGLHVSLSVPLFAGRGSTVAALNLYGRDPSEMRHLIAAVRSAYEGPGGTLDVHEDLDAGGKELIAGHTGAFAVRSIIQQAMGVVMSITGNSEQEAYTELCGRRCWSARTRWRPS